MRLYVPTNGDKIRLTADWNFTLYDESRNSSLHERLKTKQVERKNRWNDYVYSSWPAKTPVMLPAGTVLQVDRVYIRKFNASAGNADNDYDSITFQVIEHPVWKDPKKKVLARFWVKLRDANTIEFEHAAPPRWSEEEKDEA